MPILDSVADAVIDPYSEALTETSHLVAEAHKMLLEARILRKHR